MKSGIYIIKNNTTQQVYVGQSSSLKARWTNHRNKLKTNKHPNLHLQFSWNKHGESCFEWILLQEISNLNFLTSYEQSYLDYYRTLPGGVYNQKGPVDSPNKGRVTSDETKKKISLALKGEKHPLFGIFGKNHPLFGRHLTENTKRLLREANIGSIHSEERKQKNKLALKYRMKMVERINCKTGLVKEYESVLCASKDGFDRSNIVWCCNGKGKTHKGYFWQFI